MNFIKTTPDPTIQKFRTQLYKEFTAPLDAMWELLHIASSETYLVKDEDLTLGYCCIDAENSLNQIYLISSHKYLMDGVLEALIASELINSAKLSSIEPFSFNACLSRSTSTKINTFNYRHNDQQNQEVVDTSITLRPVIEDDLGTVKSYFKEEIGFDDQFGYTENLLERQELYLIEKAGKLIATGECRLSDSQPQYADVGMIVKQNQRGKGLGAKVLSELAKLARSKERIPICSTTVDNIGSQKAILKAGFHRTSIIFDLSF
ncbi:MAG: GNAT family N-acetyltransferase [Roseivirga sp.]|nr:GNAT family N-acetyltransferase [Roseivirga sp.]